MMAGNQPSVEDYFADRDFSRQLFSAVRAALEQTGPAEMRISKSQIAFRRRRGFAWVWIPGRYLRGDTAPLVLSLALPFRDPSPRWKQVVEPYPGRFMHHLELREPNEIDDQVRIWLKRPWDNA
jgi:hypothetical protein